MSPKTSFAGLFELSPVCESCTKLPGLTFLMGANSSSVCAAQHAVRLSARELCAGKARWYLAAFAALV